MATKVVAFSGGRPHGKAEDVVTGFLNANGKERGWPVGVAIDKTGALLIIADDVGNTGLEGYGCRTTDEAGTTCGVWLLGGWTDSRDCGLASCP